MSIEDPECRHWRWTSKQTLCILTNPRKDTLLIIRGTRPLSILVNQTIKMELNYSCLDEFSPRTSNFYIEHIIPEEWMGENEKITLEISIDKTFIPSDIDPQATDSRELGLQVYDLFFVKSELRDKGLRLAEIMGVS